MTQTTTQKRGPRTKPADIHVGGRIRERRTLMGMTQEKLGEAMGLTFQQIQKYERGTNRIAAGRLYDMAQIMGVPITYFFEGLDANTKAAATPAPACNRLVLDTAARMAELPPRFQAIVASTAKACLDGLNPTPAE